MFLQLTMILTRTAHCATNPILSKNAGHSETNSSTKERSYSGRKGICFKCYSSISHQAKDCKSSVKCSECGSAYHDAAMHSGPSPQSVKTSSPSPENGGKGEDHSNTAVVTTNCTEVCGPGQWSRSCSKICLIKGIPRGFQGHGHQSLCDSGRTEQSLIGQTRVLSAVQCGEQTILISPQNLLWHCGNIWEEGRRIPGRVTGRQSSHLSVTCHLSVTRF